MTVEIAIVLTVLVVAFLLFVSGALKPDLIAMLVLVLVSLVMSTVIDPAEAFAGFSSFAVIAIAGLMVIGEGLEKTGVVKWVAQQLAGIIRRDYNRLLFANTVVPGVLSGFVNIVAAASFFVPVILRLCKQMEVPQSKILLPMACTALLGANLTLIGASHNLVVDSLLAAETGAGFGFFEFTIVGAVLVAAAVIYIFVIGQRLLPGERTAPDPNEVPETVDLAEVYGLEHRLFELWVAPAEDEAAETKISSFGVEEAGLGLIALVRGSEQLIRPDADTVLEDNDTLLVLGRQEAAERFAESHHAITFMGPPEVQKDNPVSTAELAEAVVPPRSPAVGKRIRDLHLPQDYGMSVIAYYRRDRPYRTNVLDAELQEGDSLLVYGPREKMREFEPEKELLIYFKPGEADVSTKLKRKAPVAAAILLAVILGAALGFMPIAAMAIAGAVAMVLVGIVPLAEVYRVIDWRTLVLIGGMYPLGIALNSTGAADLIGETLISAIGGFGPLAVLGGVAVLAMVLTQPMHNAAVAIIMTPIALNAADLMRSDPRPFAVAVIVACSASFLMPYGHPAPLLVEKPGGYRGGDYLAFGAGLSLIVLVVIVALVPLLWPL
ncbi:SLC13 family permease [Psychromarinibacter sp. C21-152]|uniref:SLC13 family permease n=1 Tax=Psychromarinibacter sediminicola TaxID=3033385 RepID=A0AAE3NYG2_9RHOB|nr:SLC13 family permease [Psychromarinibacter sediminicola]MDF0603255.1 SLC13 family permease [Psychromarinibacter sediminicola]